MTPDLATMLEAMDAKATKGPWRVHTVVDRTEHPIPTIGLVQCCQIEHEHAHAKRDVYLTHGDVECEPSPEDDTADACVEINFGVIHPNDTRKPPLHPDNAHELATAAAVVALRNALPAFVAYVRAADALRSLDAHALQCWSHECVRDNATSLLPAYDAARIALVAALGGK